MRILLLGEASFVHNTLRKGLRELGHDVILMSEGNSWHNSPRDIDLKRNMKYGVLGGLVVLWKLLINAPRLFGNDIVQIPCPNMVPLRMRWNEILFALLKLGNKKIVKWCLGDDYIVMRGQANAVLAYSDTHVGTNEINKKENRERIDECFMSEIKHSCKFVNDGADVLLPCLYEYYKYYEISQYHDKLCYMPLPMEIPETLHTPHSTLHTPIKVLVGIQSKRDYIKGAGIIGDLVERVAAENPGKIEVKRVYDVPYDDYLKMLDEADVLVDQLYSYTPSMNSLAAMAHGTVVIGGGEEEYYEFIGEKTLRPIINVRPEDDEYNMKILRDTLLYPDKIERMKREGLEFVRKHHDYVKVAKELIEIYEKLS